MKLIYFILAGVVGGVAIRDAPTTPIEPSLDASALERGINSDQEALFGTFRSMAEGKL